MRFSDSNAFRFEANEKEPELKADELLSEIAAGKSVYVAGATISGAIKLSYQTIKSELTLQNCVVSGAFDASFANFERAVDLSGTSFDGTAFFEGTRFSNVALFSNCMFKNGGSFVQAQFARGANFHQAKFSSMNSEGTSEPEESDKITLSFSMAKAQHILRLDSVEVEGPIDCSFLEVTGTLWCTKLNAKGANFNELSVTADAHFESSVFNGSVSLMRSRITGSLYMRHSKLLGERKAGSSPTVNSFFHATIGVDAFFDGSYFKSATTFTAATIHGDCFLGQEFEHIPEADRGKGAIFDAKVECLGTRFLGELVLGGAVMNGPVSFSQALFAQRASFVGKFNWEREAVNITSARFEGETLIDSHFLGGVSFARTQFSGPLILSSDCRFEKSANLREAKIASLHFVRAAQRTHTSAPFVGSLDLRQCSYERIVHEDGIDAFWETVREKLRAQVETAPAKYDGQPYRQLETVCRRQGFDQLADDVYFERRRISSRFEKRPLFRAWDGLEWGVFGYGVKPQRMIGWFVGLWLLGTAVLLLPNALQKGKEAEPVPPPRLYSAPLLSLQNMVPGVMDGDALNIHPNYGHLVVVIVVILQHLAGWVFIALLARRFFAGLSRQEDR